MDKYEVDYAILQVSNWDWTKKDFYLNMNVFEFYRLIGLKKYHEFIQQEGNSRHSPGNN